MIIHQPEGKGKGKAHDPQHQQYAVELDVHEIVFAEQLLGVNYVLEGRHFFDELRDVVVNLVDETLGVSSGEEGQDGFEKAT